MGGMAQAFKGEHFDAIKSGIKTAGGHLVTPWRNRLASRSCAQIELASGYPHRDDSTRQLVLSRNGYAINQITHPYFEPHPAIAYAIADAPLAKESLIEKTLHVLGNSCSRSPKRN